MRLSTSNFYRFLFLIVCFSSLQVLGQGVLKGKIVDQDGNPLSFATIYQEGTTNGTTSNTEGSFVLTLPPGSHQIIARYVGHQQKLISVEIADGEITTQNIQLKPEALLLKEVVISSSDRDPAISIMRKAIKMRKLYAQEVNAYACEVYVKGLQRLDEKPNSLLGLTITVDTGIVYLSESVSKLKFERPNKINEKMISSKVSGNNNAFSYNSATDFQVNLYENSFFIEGLSERPIVSPLAFNSFNYYDFELAGTIIQDDLIINKIKLIPKRRTDPVFNGHIYIIEDSWRLHSVDVILKKENGIEFLDDVTFQQVFAPVSKAIWMPISQQFTFKFKAFGFKGSGYFTAIYRNFQVETNPEIIQKKRELNPPKKTIAVDKPEKNIAPATRDSVIQKDLFKKKDFSNAVIKVDEKANERDSLYWEQVRPIPLTSLEVSDYQVKDSIFQIKESKPYKDSIDEERNKFKWANLFFNGYTYFNSYKRVSYNFPTLFEGLQYNSVEGAVLDLEFSYQKRTKHALDFVIRPAIRYGFANQGFQAKISGLKLLNNKKQEYISGGFGRYVYQFNDQEPIGVSDNTIFTFFYGRNYARLYQKGFGFMRYQSELINGLRLNTSINYEQRTSLTNHAFYNLRGEDFDPNIPINREVTYTDFPQHQALTLNLEMRIRIAQKYIDRPERKIILDSPFPTLFVRYRRGIPILAGDTDYDLLSVETVYDFRIGLLGTSQVIATAGAFLSSKKLFFQDFQHFNGNETYLKSLTTSKQFQLLDYYLYSTRERFLEAHYEHHFNEFIFNKIPLIRRLNLQSVASLNYLSTPTLGQYIEVGVGIEHIFKFMRVDYFNSISNGQHESSGITVGAGF